MTSRSSSALLGLALCACTPTAEAPKVSEALPPPSAVQQTGKAMVTTQGYIHPTDPPGTWRARRPHGKLIEPCSDWIPNGPPITDAYNQAPGPKLMYLSMTKTPRPGYETVTATTLESVFGAPHPATKRVVVGDSAPLGPHWTWTLKGQTGPIFIAEAEPDGSIRYHYAMIGRVGTSGGTSSGLMAQCLVERYGTPGW